MYLTLNQKEVDLLLEILKGRQGTLRGEVHHTDAHAFKDELKEREKTLDCLIRKVEDLSESFSKAS